MLNSYYVELEAMVTLTREILLSRLTSYLDGQSSKEQLYEWALSVAVSKDYEEFSKHDALSAEAIEAVLDHNHAMSSKASSKQTLDYYRRCLAGEEEYKSPEERKQAERQVPQEVPPKTEKPSDPPPQPKPRRPAARKLSADKPRREAVRARKEGKPTWLTGIVPVLRGYTVLFGVCAFGIYGISLFRPDVFGKTASLTPLESFLLMMYSFLVVIPFRWTANKRAFYAVIPVLTLGMCYFWYASFEAILHFRAPAALAPLVLLFSAVPSALTVGLFARARRVSGKK